MTVAELIEQLQAVSPDAIVVMPADAEGNSYSPLDSFWAGGYRAETEWSGEAGLWELSDADRDAGYGEEDVIRDQKAIILHPTI